MTDTSKEAVERMAEALDNSQTPVLPPARVDVAATLRTLRAELDRSEARVDKLEAALKPFSDAANEYCDPFFDDDYAPRWAEFFTMGDFRRARAALADKGGE